MIHRLREEEREKKGEEREKKGRKKEKKGRKKKREIFAKYRIAEYCHRYTEYMENHCTAAIGIRYITEKKKRERKEYRILQIWEYTYTYFFRPAAGLPLLPAGGPKVGSPEVGSGVPLLGPTAGVPS